MATDKAPDVDMSPEGIADRIATVGQLYRVCLSLGTARPLTRAAHAESNPTSEKSTGGTKDDSSPMPSSQ